MLESASSATARTGVAFGVALRIGEPSLGVPAREAARTLAAAGDGIAGAGFCNTVGSGSAAVPLVESADLADLTLIAFGLAIPAMFGPPTTEAPGVVCLNPAASFHAE